MNSTATITPEQGLFELTLLNAEQNESNFEEVVLEGIKRGFPPEILTRLKELWEFSKKIAGEVIAIGKIIVKTIFDFIKANPELTIGAAIGAAVSLLIMSIPFFGPILAPLVAPIATIYGIGVGATKENGHLSTDPLAVAMALASKFFELITMIFNSIVDYWDSRD
jgi:hypothetical protein